MYVYVKKQQQREREKYELCEFALDRIENEMRNVFFLCLASLFIECEWRVCLHLYICVHAYIHLSMSSCLREELDELLSNLELQLGIK